VNQQFTGTHGVAPHYPDLTP